MPNRIIKESTFQSDKIASLSDFEFRLWVGLITAADDAGRGDARPAIIKGRIFPLRERVTNKDIETAIRSLADKGCISLYEVGGKSYFCFPTWSKHQRVRDCKPKYPGIEENDALRQVAASCGELPPNPIQSESNPNTNPNPIEANASCAEPESDSTPPAITLPLNTGEEYPISIEKLAELAGLYPAVDITQALREMRGWLIGNPQKRKTKSGIMRFVTAWLSKEQNRGGNQRGSTLNNGFQSSNPFAEMLEERRKQYDV